MGGVVSHAQNHSSLRFRDDFVGASLALSIPRLLKKTN